MPFRTLDEFKRKFEESLDSLATQLNLPMLPKLPSISDMVKIEKPITSETEEETVKELEKAVQETEETIKEAPCSSCESESKVEIEEKKEEEIKEESQPATYRKRRAKLIV